MAKNKVEYKHMELKALDDSGTIIGLGSTFGGAPDSFGDIIKQGAFRKSLRERNPIMLWQHNTSEPIGQWVEAKEVKAGLKLVGSLNLDTQRGQEAHSLLKRKDIGGLSIGFRIVKFEFDHKTGIRTITEAKLFEVSVVTFPANEGAIVTNVKNELENTFEELNIKQQQEVLRYIEIIKSLDLVEPDDVDDKDDDMTITDSIKELIAKINAKSDETDGTESTDSHHSSGEKADADLEDGSTQDEPDDEELIHSLATLTTILKGD